MSGLFQETADSPWTTLVDSDHIIDNMDTWAAFSIRAKADRGIICTSSKNAT